MTDLAPLRWKDCSRLDDDERAAANLSADTTAWLSAADPANFILDETRLLDEQLRGSVDESSVESNIAEVIAQVRASSDASTCGNVPHASADDTPESVDPSTDAAPGEQPGGAKTSLPGSQGGTANAAAPAVTSSDATAAGTGGDALGDADSTRTSASKSADSDSDSDLDRRNEILSCFLANPEDYLPNDLTGAQYAAWCMIWQPADLRVLHDQPSSRNGRPMKNTNRAIDPVNLRDPNTGATALIAAARAGCVDTVNALVRRGADVEARDNKSCTAADWARKCGHADVQAALAAAPGVQKAEQYMLRCNTQDGPQDADLIYELLCQICGESGSATWAKPEVCMSSCKAPVCTLLRLITRADRIMCVRCRYVVRHANLAAATARTHMSPRLYAGARGASHTPALAAARGAADGQPRRRPRLPARLGRNRKRPQYAHGARLALCEPRLRCPAAARPAAIRGPAASVRAGATGRAKDRARNKYRRERGHDSRSVSRL